MRYPWPARFWSASVRSRSGLTCGSRTPAAGGASAEGAPEPSEYQLQSERKHSPRPGVIYRPEPAGRIAIVVEPHGGVDSGEIRMVEDVERFSAELQVSRFADM